MTLQSATPKRPVPLGDLPFPHSSRASTQERTPGLNTTIDDDRIEANVIYDSKKSACIFSTRELEVLSLLRIGHTFEETAAELYMSRETVKSHVKNMKSKVGARNVVHLVWITCSLNLMDCFQES